MATMNGTGQGGKSFQDRVLAAEVRSLTLNKIKSLFTRPRVDMNAHDAELHDRILEKLAGSILPRINIMEGEDGGPMIIQIAGSVAKKNGIKPSTG